MVYHILNTTIGTAGRYAWISGKGKNHHYRNRKLWDEISAQDIFVECPGWLGYGLQNQNEGFDSLTQLSTPFREDVYLDLFYLDLYSKELRFYHQLHVDVDKYKRFYIAYPDGTLFDGYWNTFSAAKGQLTRLITKAVRDKVAF